jgi:hemolysin III
MSVAFGIAGSRCYTRHALVAERIIHILGVASALIGGATLVALIAGRDDGLELAALLIYAVGISAMFCCSAAYNLSRTSHRRAALRRCDHASIFVMIASSYTPFTLLRLEGAWSWGLTTAIWTIAGGGVLIKLFRPCGVRSTSAAPYLLLGWVGMVAIDPMIRSLSWETLVLIGLGGLLYTVGVFFYISDRLPFQNAIWHAFVLAAASVHYAAVLDCVVLTSA